MQGKIRAEAIFFALLWQRERSRRPERARADARAADRRGERMRAGAIDAPAKRKTRRERGPSPRERHMVYDFFMAARQASRAVAMKASTSAWRVSKAVTRRKQDEPAPPQR